MALTELQKERISFHLKFSRAKFLLAISQDTIILTLNSSQELAIIGQDLGELTSDEIYTFHGVPLCSNVSLLGQAERAFDKIGVDTIEDSLFVSEAGSVKLRGNELRNREALYVKTVTYLAQMLGESLPGSDRVGW